MCFCMQNSELGQQNEQCLNPRIEFLFNKKFKHVSIHMDTYTLNILHLPHFFNVFSIYLRPYMQ